MLNKEFYINYGKVAYALAFSDGKVQDEERRIFLDQVKEKLAPLEAAKDKFGTNVAFYADFAFESEEDIEDEVESAFEDFLLFLKTHHTHPSPEIKSACMEILENISKAYGRITQKEEALLSEFVRKVKDL